MTKRRDLPNLHDLLAFDAAVRTANFTKAAEILNVQQPAVSRRVAQLESWLGVSLFYRRGSQLSLTPQGEQFYAATRNGLDAIEAGAAKLRQRTDRKVLMIDVSIAFASCWLIERLDDFHTAHADIDVQLVTRYSNALPHSDASDVVVYFRDQEQDYPGQRCVFGEQMIAVCSPGYLQESGGSITLETLLQHPLLVLDETHHLDDWSRILGPHGLAIPGIPSEHLFNNFVVYLKAVVSGRGIGLAWRELIETELETGQLIELQIPAYRSERGYYVYHRDDAETDPDAQVFIDWLIGP